METLTLVCIVLFAVTYVLLMAIEKYRPHIAAVSAIIFIAIGSIPSFGLDYGFLNALKEIDWNVIMMIAGTMGTVYLFTESKMPQLMSDKIIEKMPNVKWAVASISLFAGIVSAFVDNVATVLMIAPVALAICKKLKISPIPSIVCIAISSNLQGASTLVGDTTSILLAKAAKLDFMSFFVDEGHVGMFFVVQAGAIASLFVILFLLRKDTQKIDAKSTTTVEDMLPTYLLLGTILTLIGISFIPYKEAAAEGQFYKPAISNGLVCIGFFLIGLLREVLIKKNSPALKASLKEIDHSTIILLTSLFVVIGGIKSAGVIDLIGSQIAKAGGGSSGVFIVYTIIVWGSVLISAFIDNIPYTATMLPIVAVVASSLAIEPKLLYYGLLCGATLGGNLTPIGASANITGIGILKKEGHEVKAPTFMKFSIPFTLSAVTAGYILIWLIWK